MALSQNVISQQERKVEHHGIKPQIKEISHILMSPVRSHSESSSKVER